MKRIVNKLLVLLFLVGQINVPFSMEAAFEDAAAEGAAEEGADVVGESEVGGAPDEAFDDSSVGGDAGEEDDDDLYGFDDLDSFFDAPDLDDLDFENIDEMKDAIMASKIDIIDPVASGAGDIAATGVKPQPGPDDADSDAANQAKTKDPKEAKDESEDEQNEANQQASDINEASREKVQAKKDLDRIKEQTGGLDGLRDDEVAAEKTFKDAQEKFENGDMSEDDFNDAKKTYEKTKERINKDREELTDAQKRSTKANEDYENAKSVEKKYKKVRAARDDVQAEKDALQDKYNANTRHADDLKDDLGISKKSVKEQMNDAGYGDATSEDEFKENYKAAHDGKEPSEQDVDAFKQKLEGAEDSVRMRTSGDITDEDIDAALKEKFGEGAPDEIDGDFTKEDYDAEKAKWDDLKKTQDEMRVQEDQLDTLDKQLDELSKDTRKPLIDTEFWKEQLTMALVFMIPGDIVNAIEQMETEKLLYETISRLQTFGGIQMKIPSGFIITWNAASSLFIYDDGNNNNYESTTVGYYASYDQYGDVAQNYLGSGKVSQMLHFNTGTIFDGSGVVDKMVPLFKNKTAPSQNQQSSSGNTQEDIQEQYRFISGQVKSKVRVQSSMFGVAKSYKGNPTIAAWFKPGGTGPKNNYTSSVYAHAGGKISPLLYPTLAQFRLSTELPLFGVYLSEMTGIGAMIEVFSNFSEWFTDPEGQTETGKSKIGIEVLTKLAAGVDLDDGANWTSDSVLAKAGVGTASYLDKITRLIGQGIYLYQSDKTALAQFLKTRVDAALQDYVHDYLVCLDENYSIVSAFVTQIEPSKSPKIQWVPNPNVSYVVSLVNGATFAPGGKGMPLTNPGSDTLDYTIANKAKAAVKTAYGSSPGIEQQLGAMKFFAENIITQGPFKLSSTATAYLVTDLESEVDTIAGKAIMGKVNALNKLAKQTGGASGSGSTSGTLSTADSTVKSSTKKAMLEPGGGVYIYRINSKLPGLIGGEKVMLPDYVVAVAPGSGSNFQIVPLGMQAAVKSGTSLPKVSSSVTALVSLITGKVYTPSYTLLPKAITTDIYSMQSPGVPYVCPKGGGVLCANGHEVQQGGMNAPLATAFMETDLNPLNKETDQISMWPFYFLMLEYDYCPQGTVTKSGSSQTAIASYFTDDFLTVNQCTQSQTMTVPLYRILPQTFTGIPWPATVEAVLGKKEKEATALKNMLNSLAPSSTTKTSKTKTTKPLELNTKKAAKQSDYSLAEVHGAWRAGIMSNQKDQWSLLLAEGPHNFTANAANDWTITAESAAVADGVYLYSVQSGNKMVPLDGLWVAAKASSTGTTVTSPQYRSLGESLGLTNQKNGVTIVKTSSAFALKGSSSVFTKIGADFSENSDLNALINVGNGTILLKTEATDGKGNTLDVMAPVANLWGGLYQLDPTDVLKALPVKPTGMLKAQVDSLQSGNLSTQYGPYSFGPFTMFIDRAQINDGNYIYQAYTQSTMKGAPATDYLVVANEPATGNGLTLGGPLEVDTQSLLSLVSGIKYARTGAVDALWKFEGQRHVIQYATIMPNRKGSTSLLGYCNTIFKILETNGTNSSGREVPTALKTAIRKANKAYVAELEGNKKQADSDKPTTYGAAVTQALNEGKTNFTFPEESDLTHIPSNGDDDGTPIYKDTKGNYYIKSNAITSVTIQGNGYYAFNVATPNEKDIQVIPTGVYFEVPSAKDADTSSKTPSVTEPTARNVLFGHAATAMASAHGITISPIGKESRTFPVKRKALAMTKKDIDLAGGKDGTLMKKLQPEPVLKTGKGTLYYLYQNIANFNPVTLTESKKTGSRKLVNESSPSDILLQVNIPKEVPYYMSLITGLEYSLNGQPLIQNADVYLTKKKDGSLNTEAPLVVWGHGEAMKLYVPSSYNGSYSDIRFTEYFISAGGMIYQYTDKSGKIYNFTHIDPSTNKPTQNAYQVRVDNGKKTLVKSWKGEKEVKGEQVTPMAQALAAAQKDGLIPSQRVLNMTTQNYNALVTNLLVKYNSSTGKWLLYDNTFPSDPSPVGEFETALNPDYTPLVLATVTNYLGSRGEGDSGQLLKGASGQGMEATLERLVYFTDNIEDSKTKGEINGVSWLGRYYKLDAIKHDYYINKPANDTSDGAMLSFVEAVSPLLYCADNSKSKTKACKVWPSESRGTQLPTDVSYFSVRNAGGDTNYIYGHQFPEIGEIDLDRYYGGLKLRPVSSNRGIKTLVKFLDVKSLKALSTSYIGRPAAKGKKAESYSAYKARIMQKVKTFYAKKSSAVSAGAAKTVAAAEKNAENQGKQITGGATVVCGARGPQVHGKGKKPQTSKNATPVMNSTEPKPWCKRGLPCPATPPAGAIIWHACSEAQGVKEATLKEVRYHQKVIAMGQKEATKKLTDAFAMIEKNIGNLYYDTTNKMLVYKVTPADYIPFVDNGYVSFPFGDHPGGFIFDEKGVPIGAVVSLSNMDRLTELLAGLKAVSTNPLRLGIPKIVNENYLTIPSIRKFPKPVQKSKPSKKKASAA